MRETSEWWQLQTCPRGCQVPVRIRNAREVAAWVAESHFTISACGNFSGSASPTINIVKTWFTCLFHSLLDSLASSHRRSPSLVSPVSRLMSNPDFPPQDVYVECLPKSRGYPLWDPEPSSTLPSSYRQDGLQIGDVGCVSRSGTFNVLFNICYGLEHSLHRSLANILDQFHPIPLDIEREVVVKLNADPSGCVIMSGTNLETPK